MIDAKSIICLFSIVCFGDYRIIPSMAPGCQIYDYDDETDSKSLICPNLNTKSSQLNKVNINTLAITGLPSYDQESLCELNFKHLIIQDAKLSNSETQVTNCDHLSKKRSHKTLTIKNTIDADAWSWSKFNFKHVHIEECSVSDDKSLVLHADKFESSDTQSLSIVNCNIHTIEDNWLDSFESLRSLVVRGNLIKTFSRSMLPRKGNNLWYLDLSHNQLTDLNGNLFTGLSSLKELYLQNNLLTSFSWTLFNPIFTSLDILNIQNNAVLCESFCWAFSKESDPHSAFFDLTKCSLEGSDFLLGTLNADKIGCLKGKKRKRSCKMDSDHSLVC